MESASLDRPPRWEHVAVWLLLAGFLALNICSYNRYPAVWCDEILYSEPAINLVRHGSYTAAAYEFQPPNTFPIVNCPLYGLTLVPWLWITGTSLLSVRSFNYALMALATYLLWRASWRFGLVRTSFLRLLMVLIVHLGYGMSYCYRSCRPDMLGMVCLLLLLFCFGIASQRRRSLCLLGLAAVAVWIGLQVALYAWFACVVGWIFFGQPRFAGRSSADATMETTSRSRFAAPAWPQIFAVSLGIALGMVTLVLFLSWKNMLAWFLPPVLGVVKGTFYSHPVHHSLGGVLAGFVKRSLGDCLEDFSMVMLTPLLLLLLIVPPGRISPRVRRIVLYGFALAFGAPALFEAVGHFAFYYSYLRWVPAVLVLFAAASDLWARNESGPPRWLAFGFGLTLAAAVAVGLPLRLGLALACGRLVPRTEIQNLLRSRITPQDTAFSEYLPFFEVKQIAPVVYDLYSSPALSSTGVPGLDLTTKTKQAVSVMVIRPEERERLGAFFGGQWQPVGGPFGDTQDFGFLTRIPIVGRRFVSYSLQPQNERYQLQVFRRAAAQPPDTRDRDGK